MEETKNNIPQVDTTTGALALIDILYKKKIINKTTYNNIQKKYNNK